MVRIIIISVLVYIAGSVIVSTVSGNLGGYVLPDSSVSDSTVTSSNDSLSRLAEGKTLYKLKCSKCHALHKPKEYKLKIWKENLDEMKEKAALTNNEYDLILNYLKTNCKK